MRAAGFTTACALAVCACGFPRPDLGDAHDGAPAADSSGGPVDALGTVTVSTPSDIVQPGTEETSCIDIKLSNDSAFDAGHLHVARNPGTYVAIIYRNDTPDEVEGPKSCSPYAGLFNTTGKLVPLALVKRSTFDLEMPAGVGFPFASHQMLRIELHNYNSLSTAKPGGVAIAFSPMPTASFVDEARMLFVGSIDISLSPSTALTVASAFAPNRAGLEFSTTMFFAIEGHTHLLGRALHVSSNEGALYDADPFDPDEPATISAPFSLSATDLLSFSCTYDNTTDVTVRFGEAVADEMCFFSLYYAPPVVSSLCFHTSQGNTDECCPGGSICNAIAPM